MDISGNKNSMLTSEKMKESIFLLNEIVNSMDNFISATNPPFCDENSIVSRYYGEIRVAILNVKKCILAIKENGNVVNE